jgi:hypothetical protein
VIGGFVTAIAKGLVGAQAAGTPEVALAGFEFHRIRTFLSNFRFGHREISSVGDIGIIAEVDGAAHSRERVHAAGFRERIGVYERK